MMFLKMRMLPPQPPQSNDNIQPLIEGSAASHPIQLESEPDKEMPDLNPNSGKSPISKSLDEIINIVKNSHQGESPNYNDINTRVKTLEKSMISISTLC